METYNKIILKVWWTIAIASFVITTVMGFIQGFDRWVDYYVLTALALFIVFVRRYTAKKVYPTANKESDTSKK